MTKQKILMIQNLIVFITKLFSQIMVHNLVDVELFCVFSREATLETAMSVRPFVRMICHQESSRVIKRHQEARASRLIQLEHSKASRASQLI